MSASSGLVSSPVEEGGAELAERTEGFVGVHDESVARNHVMSVTLSHDDEPVSGRLRPHPDTGEVTLE